MFMTNIDPPAPPEWWDPRPATVRYHRPGWRVLVFFVVVLAATVSRWVAGPERPQRTRSDGAA